MFGTHHMSKLTVILQFYLVAYFIIIIIIIIIIYLPRVCKSNDNNSEQTVVQDSKATQDARITARKNYAYTKETTLKTNTSELNKIHPVYLPNKT